MRSCIHLLAAGLLSVGMSGCSDAAREKDRVNAILASQIHQIVMAIHAYTHEHQGLFPDHLDQLADQVGDVSYLADLMRHPGTGEAIGVIYVKPGERRGKLADPSYTPMLHEARDGKIHPTGWIGYADGSVRLPEVSK